MAVYKLPKLESIGVFNSVAPTTINQDSYVGSATRFMDNQPISKYLFAMKVTRKCEEGEPFCLEISDSDNGALLFIERIFLAEMQTGPNRNSTVKPIVYHFSQKLVL